MTRLKTEILAGSIDDDQRRVASQWALTFQNAGVDDLSSDMAQLMVSCVAKGDFQVHNYLSGEEGFEAPEWQLNSVDYLSHASRIIIDYRDLSRENQLQLLRYFPFPHENSRVFSRSATHAVGRTEEGNVVEHKGFLLGLVGQLPEFIKKAFDFGLNIAMGGEGRLNGLGKKIMANGYSGHLYFHRYDEQQLLMFGLEQSAPAASALSLIWGDPHLVSDDEQYGTDQFGQGHSLVGASDVYTAAGSLYFSNPIYQAKLMVEKGCFPPDKYGAMQVKITDENWPDILAFLERLQRHVERDEGEALVNQLMEKPATARLKESRYKSYIALDFEQYLKQIYRVFVIDKDLPPKQQQYIQEKQTQLLNWVQRLQAGEPAAYKPFLQTVHEFAIDKTVPKDYVDAITRIAVLFEKQMAFDPELKQSHVELMLQSKYDDLLSEIGDLMNRIQELQEYFKSEFIVKDERINDYEEALHRALQELLEASGKGDDHKVDLSMSVMTSSLAPMSRSWVLMESIHDPELEPIIDETTIERLETVLLKARAMIEAPPKLHSDRAMELLTGALEVAHKKAEALDEEILALQQQIAEDKQSEQQRLYERAQKSEDIKQRYNRRRRNLSPVISALAEIEKKKNDFKNRKEKDACEAVERLVSNLNRAMDTYLDNDNEEKEALASFKEAARQCVKDERNILKHHRKEWKIILANVLIAITVVGVGVMIGKKMATGHGTFFRETDSVNKLNQLGSSVEEVKAPSIS